MAAPEYMPDLRKSLQLCFGVYTCSWLQLVDLVSRLDTSEVYETFFFLIIRTYIVNYSIH